MRRGNVIILVLILGISLVVFVGFAYRQGFIKLSSDKKVQENANVLSSPTPISSNLGDTIPPDEVLVYGNLPGFDKKGSADISFTSPTFKIAEGGLQSGIRITLFVRENKSQLERIINSYEKNLHTPLKERKEFLLNGFKGVTYIIQGDYPVHYNYYTHLYDEKYIIDVVVWAKDKPSFDANSSLITNFISSIKLKVDSKISLKDEKLTYVLPNGWTKKLNEEGYELRLFSSDYVNDPELFTKPGVSGWVYSKKTTGSFNSTFQGIEVNKYNKSVRKIKVGGFDAASYFTTYEGRAYNYEVYKEPVDWVFSFAGANLDKNIAIIDQFMSSIKFK